jgi:LacI family transcriptional regulator
MVPEPVEGTLRHRFRPSARLGDHDAILCGSDQIARGALDTARELGWDVPGRVALMGFDNWEVFSLGSRPHLTSVDMNLEQLGRTAARRLFEAIEGGAAAGVELLPCRVVPRETT